jgi:hypothetical protein
VVDGIKKKPYRKNSRKIQKKLRTLLRVLRPSVVKKLTTEGTEVWEGFGVECG